MVYQSEDSYKYGIVTAVLLAVAPLPMVLAGVLRVLSGELSLKFFRWVMPVLTVGALLTGAGEPGYFLPAMPVVGILLKKWTITQYIAGLLHPNVIKPMLWLIPTAYSLQELLLHLMNDKPKPPKLESNGDTCRVNCNQEQNPDKGVLIGVTAEKKSLFITPGELNKHIALIGTTGSGKTTTLYNFIEYNALKKQACIIIDGKGDQEFLHTAKTITRRTGQEPILFAIDGDYPGYNPFATGSPTEIADKIMALMDYSEEHYEKNAQTFIQLLMRGLVLNKIPVTLESIVTNFSKVRVQALLSPHSTIGPIQSDDLLTPLIELSPEDQENTHYLAILEQLDKRAIEGLTARLGTLATGDTWEALRMRPKGLISLSEAMDSRKIVIFSLDSLKYPETARAFGRLVVGDIKAQISEHMSRRRGQRVGLLFDEFNVFVSSSVVDVVNKSRAAGFEALLAFQSLADIDVLEKGEEIRRQIIQSCNTLIIQRQNDPTDAEELARAIGTRDSYQMTYQVETQGATGFGSARPVKEFIVHPDDIKGLRTGEAYVKRHTSKGLEVKKVWVRRPRVCE